MPYLGETCAIAAAICWTGSGLTFGWASRAVGPLPTNQFRLLAAVPMLLLLSWWITGQCWPVQASTERVGWLVASGLIGLVLGDIGYFYALATIGPRLSSVVFAAWPACTVAIDATLGRSPTVAVLAGITMTMLGVVVVLLRAREGTAWNPDLPRSRWWLGVAGALLGAVGQAVGYIISGYGMNPASDLPAGVPVLQATVVRMAAGALGMQLVLTTRRQPLLLLQVCRHRLARWAAVAGALMGPVGGVWLSMVARREATDNGVAAALMSTTPIFMMPVAAIAYRARVGWLGAFGTILCVGGVVVCVLER